MPTRLLFILLTLALLLPSPLGAQLNTAGIAMTYLMEGEVKNGDIVSLLPGTDKLGRSVKDYDERMYGVVVLKPEIVYRTVEGGIPVVRNGEVMINVTLINGGITSGDYITSTQIPGHGQKATELAGFVIGTALSSFDGTNAPTIDFAGKKVAFGQVKIALGIGPASPVQVRATGGVFGTIRFMAASLLSTIATSKQAERVVRIVLAGLVALLTLYVNFHSFGKNITKGIESIGRNPLAKATIQSMIVLNIILIGLVTLGGIFLSLTILSL